MRILILYGKWFMPFENKDYDKAYSYYDDKATFIDINSQDINKEIHLG